MNYELNNIVKNHAPDERISTRKNAEDDARTLIVSNLGNLDQEQIKNLFQIIDRDFWSGKQVQGRFGITFQGANSKKICSQLEKANEWIKAFWEVSEDDVYNLVERFMKEKPILGAGYGFPSLILYLRDSHKFNMWLNVMIWGLECIESGSFKGNTGEAYQKYNEALIAFREKHSLAPQAMDIILTLIYEEQSGKSGSKYWWVNQGSSYEFEKNGEYIFAPLADPRGVQPIHWSNLGKVKRDNIIFHYSNGTLLAVSKVVEEAVEAERPDGTGKGEKGLLVRTELIEVQNPLPLNDIPIGLRIEEKGPFNKNGGVKQGYLFQLSEKFVRNVSPLLKGIDFLGHVIKSSAPESQHKKESTNFTISGKNFILYGPPGTGKTYKLAQYFDKYKTNNVGESEESYLARLVAEKPWWQVVGAAVLDKKKTRVPALLMHPLVQAKLSQTSIQSPNARLWATLQSHAVQDCPNLNYQRRLEPQFFWKDTDSTWSLKEDLLPDLAPEIIQLKNQAAKIPIAEIIERYEFVTFHQSYGYEEFVEGIRPMMEGTGEGELEYRVEPGIFKKICRRAEKDPANEYAIFIDEINRGNISKIFGELITLIEPDKRVTPEGKGMRARLPYSKEEFGVPANLSIIGTMNTADRSIAFIDIALRRRFQFREMMPNLDLISEKVGENGVVDGVNVRDLLHKINRRIEFLYDRDHMIGHSYFLNCSNLDHLKIALLQSIIPLLQEYFYGDWEKICLVLGCGTDGNGGGVKNQYPIIKTEKLVEKEVLGLDHLDFDDCCRYEVCPDFSGSSGELLRKYLVGIYQPSPQMADAQEG